MSTLLQLKAKLDALNRDIETARARELPAALATCIELIQAFDFTAYDLGLVRTQTIPARANGPHTFPLKTRRGAQPPRYRNPDTGETWSGFGRRPAWLVGVEQDEYLIEGITA